MGLLLKTGKLATRKAYGLALRVFGHVQADIYALDGDVRNSTFAEWFANDAELADRFHPLRIEWKPDTLRPYNELSGSGMRRNLALLAST